MKFENFQDAGNERHERNAEEQKVYSDMVRSLMYDRVRELGLAPDDDITPVLIDWVEEQDKNFEAVFNTMIGEDPNLVENWHLYSDAIMEKMRERFREISIPSLPEEFKKAA